MTTSCSTTATWNPPLAMRWLAPAPLSPAQHLALDHALIEAADQHELTHETLRIWEPVAPMVVLGRSSCHAEEVDLTACQTMGVPVLRRISGGATILTGPGCLMYSVLINLETRPELKSVDHAHQLVLDTLAQGLQPIAPSAHCAGTSDLVLRQADTLRKFSGNALRVGKRWMLYHGTLMYAMDLSLIGTLLKEPPRQPGYRQRRPHRDFVMNLPTDRETLCSLLRGAFNAEDPLQQPPVARTAELVASHYSRDEWNLQR